MMTIVNSSSIYKILNFKVLGFYGGHRRKKKDISLSFSHTEHNASSLEPGHIYLVREVHLFHVLFEEGFSYVLVLSSFA